MRREGYDCERICVCVCWGGVITELPSFFFTTCYSGIASFHQSQTAMLSGTYSVLIPPSSPSISDMHSPNEPPNNALHVDIPICPYNYGRSLIIGLFTRTKHIYLHHIMFSGFTKEETLLADSTNQPGVIWCCNHTQHAFPSS